MLWETQMKITWTNCDDAMPPDTNEHFIIRLLAFPKVIQSIDGNQAQDLNRYSWEWTPYTPEKWKELNK